MIVNNLPPFSIYRYYYNSQEEIIVNIFLKNDFTNRFKALIFHNKLITNERL